MTTISEKLSCTYCSEKSKIYFICPNCGKRFCSKHRRPKSHQCSSTKFAFNEHSPPIAQKDIKTYTGIEKTFVHYPNPKITKLIKEIGERERISKINTQPTEKRKTNLADNTIMFRVKLINLRTKP